ncbi:unnamed protein product [Clavelina lepadiformis]|uniref:Uncharacterized protein n=1 Tax=Clavelina lepadiformis TaxID=159417 RepID=A0ABP0EYS4_CLALP
MNRIESKLVFNAINNTKTQNFNHLLSKARWEKISSQLLAFANPGFPKLGSVMTAQGVQNCRRVELMSFLVTNFSKN